MTKKHDEVEETFSPDVLPEEVEVKKEKKVASDVTKVKFEGGVREYSQAKHGDKHAELAKEFASKDSRRQVL